MTAASDGLHALDTAAVPYCVRNDPEGALDPPPGGDVDVFVPIGALADAEARLRTAGFQRLAARGHPGHRFFVACRDGRWTKFDVMWERRYDGAVLPVDDVIAARRRWESIWVAGPEHQSDHEQRRARGERPTNRIRERLVRSIPLGWRRRGAVIAVLGPDGAGKSTVLEGVAASLPVATSVIYLGTGRSGHGTPSTTSTRAPNATREVLFLARKTLRSWRRLAPVYARAWRGHVVLTDRHPIEVRAIQPERGPLATRVERSLTTLLPRPDRIVILEAPAEVLVARKQEHPVATIARWVQGYRTAFPDASFVAADRSIDQVVGDVLDEVWLALAARRGWRL